MNCTICGFDNPADGRFCKKCGAALIAPPLQARPAADLAGAAPAAASASAATMEMAPATGGGIPKPYIVIAVIALVILAGAWAAWRSLGDGQKPADSSTPATAVAPSGDTKPDATAGTPAAPDTATGSATAGDAKPADTTPASAGTSAPSGTADNNAAPVIAAPTDIKPAAKAAHKAPSKAPVIAAPKQVAPAPSTAAAPAPRAAPAAAAPRRDRWALMGDEMTACGRGNNFLEKVVCEQKVRYKYCDGYWGNVPQCPTGPAKDTAG